MQVRKVKIVGTSSNTSQNISKPFCPFAPPLASSLRWTGSPPVKEELGNQTT